VNESIWLTQASTLDLHITDIFNVLEFEELDQVILVGHSYAGMVITGVADSYAPDWWTTRRPLNGGFRADMPNTRTGLPASSYATAVWCSSPT